MLLEPSFPVPYPGFKNLRNWPFSLASASRCRSDARIARFCAACRHRRCFPSGTLIFGSGTVRGGRMNEPIRVMAIGAGCSHSVALLSEAPPRRGRLPASQMLGCPPGPDPAPICRSRRQQYGAVMGEGGGWPARPRGRPGDRAGREHRHALPRTGPPAARQRLPARHGILRSSLPPAMSPEKRHRPRHRHGITVASPDSGPRTA